MIYKLKTRGVKLYRRKSIIQPNFQWKFCKLDKAANFKLSNQNSGYQ